MIHAEVKTDDGRLRVSFDATKWFEQATDEQVAELADCNQGCDMWGGDYPSDNVAIFMAGHDDNVRDLFKYLEIIGTHARLGLTETVGFECYVDSDDANEWLRQHGRQSPDDEREERETEYNAEDFARDFPEQKGSV